MAQRTIDLVVHGGRVALPGGVVQTAIAIDGERIVAVGEAEALPPARDYLDVTGKDVLPGVIDAHSHLGFDDWSSLPRTSAFGGVTTSIPFVGGATTPGSVPEIIRANQEEAARRSVLDVAFHAYLFPRPRAANPFEMLDGMAEGVKLGVRSYKMFTAYRKRGMMAGDDFIFRACRLLAAHGGLPMIHAENGDLIDALEEQRLAEGKVGPEHYHDSRPPEAEAEAIAGVAALASYAQTPLYIVHLSTELGLNVIRERQRAGQALWCETCPQYLALGDEAVQRRGAFAKIAPPLRRAPDVQAMWRGLSEGTISVVASDHSPHDPALKARANDGRNIFYLDDGGTVPFGMPGAETLAPVLYSEAVSKRRLPLDWLARVLSENPARIFGLHPRKGVIAPGSDADLTIFDPSRRLTIREADLHSRTGYSVYEGIEVQGWPLLSLLRGKILLRDGELCQPEGYGRFIPAGPPSPPIQGVAATEHFVPTHV
ncbi:MAG TPA: amidohydrolase family protein [Dehalococcoidia bacterium]|nr:amidohydrolase family protein [Dehalococcoidia bacterium]